MPSELPDMQGKDSSNNPSVEPSRPYLFGKIVKGSLWTFALRSLIQLLSVIRHIILLRVLGIEDVGLLGVAALTIQILNTFTTTGFQAALIQKKQDIRDYLNTAWTLGIIRGSVLFILLYFAAPLAASLKVPADKIPLTIDIIRIIGLTLILNEFNNIGIVYFRKELQFKKLFAYHSLALLIDAVVTIVIALIYRSLWALVIGKLCGETLRCLMSYILHPYRPRFHFDYVKARHLWAFGKWILFGAILGFIIQQGDNMFVWGYLGISALAVYQYAYKFANIPATEIGSVINQVTFSAFSKIQDDIPRLRKAYFKVLAQVSCLSFPLSVLICVLTPEFVTVFLKSRWLGMIPVMQILIFKGLVSSIGVTRGPVFLAVGRPRLGVTLKTIRIILLVVLIWPLTAWKGVVGTALAVLIVRSAVQPVGIYLLCKILRCGFMESLKPLLLPGLACLFMAGVMYAGKFVIFREYSATGFFGLAIIGIAAYIGALWCLDKYLEQGVLGMFREQAAVLLGRKKLSDATRKNGYS